jgi:DNA gyrase subunit A
MVFATRRGVVKKTPLQEYANIRSNGLKAINLKEDEDGIKDELAFVGTANRDDTVICVSKKGHFVRFSLSDETIRPLSRIAAGVKGQRYRDQDELLAARIIPAESSENYDGLSLVTVTEAGFAKRTPVADYPIKGRGGMGSFVAKVTEKRGDLAGAVVVSEDDELLLIMESGMVVRSDVNQISPSGRTTQGVVFARPADGDSVISVARNVERDLPETDADRAAAENAPVAPATDAPVAADADVENADVAADADDAAETTDTPAAADDGE